MQLRKPDFSPLFRLWHWTMAFSVLGLIGTVFLRMTFLNKNANARIIQEKLADYHLTINHEQAVTIAKAIRAEMWQWHYILAIFLGVAILLRIVAMLRGEANSRSSSSSEAKGRWNASKISSIS